MESTKNKVILLVEDNADEEALAIRGRDLSLAPQIELLDLKLPRVSGLEAAPFGMITRRLMFVADEICPP